MGGGRKRRKITLIQQKIRELALVEVENHGAGRVLDFGESVSHLTVNEMFRNCVFI